MKRTLLFLVMGLSLTACEQRSRLLPQGERLDNAGHTQVLMQAIKCCPGQITPGNETKCQELRNQKNGQPFSGPSAALINFGGVYTSGVFQNEICTGWDETPFWGNLQ